MFRRINQAEVASEQKNGRKKGKAANTVERSTLPWGENIQEISWKGTVATKGGARPEVNRTGKGQERFALSFYGKVLEGNAKKPDKESSKKETKGIGNKGKTLPYGILARLGRDWKIERTNTKQNT